MTTKFTAVIPALCVLTFSTSAFAGRPLATEDAGVNDKGTCQLTAEPICTTPTLRPPAV